MRAIAAAAVITILAILALWLIGSGTGARLVLAAKILDELQRPRPDSWLQRTTPAPLERPISLEASGLHLAADLYQPGAGPATTPLIFIPGAVEQGKNEPRVAPFARLLARAGFTVVVPDLPSFRALTVDPENLRELGAALEAVTGERSLAPQGRAGMLGVSYAGGMAVRLALEPKYASRASFVVTVGGYADLDSVVWFLATGRATQAGRVVTVGPDPYGQLVFLKTYEEFLSDPRDRRLLEAMAARRMVRFNAPLGDLAAGLGPEGRLIYDLFETASPERVRTLMAQMPPTLRQRLNELSPARQDWSHLEAHLYIAHAQDDRTFPASEAQRLAALGRTRTRVHLLTLERLQHVDLQPWRRNPWLFVTHDLPEACRLVGWWAELLRERERRPTQRPVALTSARVAR